MGSIEYIIEFNKAHGALGFGAEVHAFIACAFREELAEFVFDGIGGQVADIKCVARWVLIGQVGSGGIRSHHHTIGSLWVSGVTA